MTATVATTTHEHDKAVSLSRLPRTLMGGTRAMRAAGEKYLPKFASESQANFNARLARSTLFNAFKKTVSDMTGKVFSKEIQLGDDVPNEIKALAENVDLAGRHLNVFARDVFYDGMQTGGGYILVDAPPAITRTDGLPATIAHYKAAGWRPYLVYIPIERLIGWKSELINGVETLTQVRILECVSEPDGEYAEKEIEQIRVLTPGRWETWRKASSNSEWTLFEEGTTSLPRITLVPVYINRSGFMTFSPPLEELADLNVAHWQSQSDQRNILTVARVPILFATGMGDDSVLEIGAASMVRNSNPAATMQYVEHSGAAIGAGDKDLQNLEFQMQNHGLQLLIHQPGQTATGEIRDDSKENSPLAMMAMALGDAIEQAFGYMGEYLALGTDKSGSVTMNKEFGISGNIAEVQYLTQAVISDKIDNATYLAELKRRGVLADSVDVEVVLSRLDTAPPSLSGAPMNLHEH